MRAARRSRHREKPRCTRDPVYPHAENGRAEPRPTRICIGEPGNEPFKPKEKSKRRKGIHHGRSEGKSGTGILGRPRHVVLHQVAPGEQGRRRHRCCGRRGAGARGPREDQAEGAQIRRARLPGGGHAGDVRQGVPGQGSRCQRHVREQVPAGLGAVAAAHLQAPRGCRPQVRREVHRARLHGQGQRPGALRVEHHDAGPRHRDPRPGARVGAQDPARGDGVGAGPRH